MTDLERIEREAKERRERDAGVDEERDEAIRYDQAEAAVDELIAIMKVREEAVAEIARRWERDKAERDEARAAVLTLRDALKTYDSQWGEYVGVTRSFHQQTDGALVNTESYEQYRTAPDAG